MPQYPNHVIMYFNDRGVIPCGVCDPELNVTLEKISFVNKSLGPEHGVVFNPMEGFIIEKVGGVLDGLHQCTVVSDNKTYIRHFTVLIQSKYSISLMIKPPDMLIAKVVFLLSNAQ